MGETGRPTSNEAEERQVVPGPAGGVRVPLDYELRHPVRHRTVRPPGVMSKAMWWMSYRVGRAMGKVLVKPRKRERG